MVWALLLLHLLCLRQVLVFAPLGLGRLFPPNFILLPVLVFRRFSASSSQSISRTHCPNLSSHCCFFFLQPHASASLPSRHSFAPHVGRPAFSARLWDAFPKRLPPGWHARMPQAAFPLGGAALSFACKLCTQQLLLS